MRFTTALLVSSAAGISLAAHEAVTFAWASPAETTVVPAMVESSSSSSAMMHVASTSSAAMAHTAMTSSAMAAEATSAAAMTTAIGAYTASMAAPAASGGPATHTVTVGGTAGLVYAPSQIVAAVNDVVQFVFMSQNHTVTESTFALPCNKKAADAPDSGFMANPNNTIVPAPTWEYTVTGTEATWWYCKQRTGTHCGKGMVFAINPTVEKTFDTFKAAAIMLNGTAATTTASATAAETTAAGTVTLIASTTSQLTDAVATATGGAAPIQTGWNEGGASCQCACFCGVAAFPQGDGIGAYGGYGGSLPAPW
ncbi:uncharacterized protein LAJ45_00883 [Morchella importuna]|nr:uncharacterized protein LAJ45_00883 [Morchella importuna]KAH8155871.1 hypothetical protein LAJ45_00883 [Morchella importuna]